MILRPAPDAALAEGLYDPAFEHDACGVAFVATLTGVPSHAIVAKGLEALRNLDHRGATGADPKTGDGAGHPDPGPGRLPARRGGLRRCPGRARTRSATPSCPPTPDAREKAKAADRADRRRGAPAGARLARRCRTDDASLSDLTRSNMPHFEQLFVTAAGRAGDGHRAGPAGVLPAPARPARDRASTSPRCPARTLVYKGMLTTEQLELVFPELLRRADGQRAGGRALPLLDQHVPGLGAGPPVPDDRAQRRDQHRQGQPELDAGPRGAAAPAT